MKVRIAKYWNSRQKKWIVFKNHVVTRTGKVYRWTNPTGRNTWNTCEGKEMAIYVNRYPSVRLRHDHDPKRRVYRIRLHQLVAHTYLGKPPEGMEIRHLDDNKENCHIDNLVYGTRKQNVADASRNGCPCGWEKYWQNMKGGGND